MINLYTSFKKPLTKNFKVYEFLKREKNVCREHESFERKKQFRFILGGITNNLNLGLV